MCSASPTDEEVRAVQERGGHERRWWLLVGLVPASLVLALDGGVLPVALARIQRDVGATQGQLAEVVAAYPLVLAALLPLGGVLGGRFGRRRLLVLGFCVLGSAAALSGLASSPRLLVVGRALMGAGAAAVLSSTLALISSVFRPTERDRAMAIWAGAGGTALLVAPVVGGLLLARLWWGSVFLLDVPVVVLGLAGVLWLAPESRDTSAPRVDPAGALLCVAGLLLLAHGTVGLGGARWASPSVLGPLLGGVLLLALLLVRQRGRLGRTRAGDAAVPAGAGAVAVGAVAVAFAVLAGTTFCLSLYLQDVRALSPLGTGIVLMFLPAGLVLGGGASTRWVDRFGGGAVCAAALLIVALALSGYRFLSVGTPLVAVLLLLVVQGVGTAHVVGPAAVLLASAPRPQRGVLGAAQLVGGGLGLAVLGTLLSASYRSHAHGVVSRLAPHEAFVAALHATFTVAAAFTLLAVLVVASRLWRPRDPAPPRPEPLQLNRS